MINFQPGSPSFKKVEESLRKDIANIRARGEVVNMDSLIAEIMRLK